MTAPGVGSRERRRVRAAGHGRLGPRRDPHQEAVSRQLAHDGRVLGHEAVGTVEAVGSQVTTVEPGDRVLVSRFVTHHHFSFDRFMEAYEVFTPSAQTKALKIVVTPEGVA